MVITFLESKSTKNFVIYGFPGFGRKTSVRYVIDDLNAKYKTKMRLLEINANVYTSE